MNEKQAKRIRQAARSYVNAERTSLSKGPRAVDVAGQLAKQLHIMWPALNHKQRGAVSFYTRGYWAFDLPRAVQRAIRFVTA